MLRLFITGKPGVGKTTLLMRLINELKRENFKVTGFYCPEIRRGNTRIGFKIVSVSSGKESLLATTEKKGDIRIGKYFVVLNDEFVKNLENEIFSNPDLIAIDEIGPMELSIPPLKLLIGRVLNSEYPLVAVVHRSIKLNGETVEVNIENRDKIYSYVKNKVLGVLKK